jgi:hypothetical protein
VFLANPFFLFQGYSLINSEEGRKKRDSKGQLYSSYIDEAKIQKKKKEMQPVGIEPTPLS